MSYEDATCTTLDEQLRAHAPEIVRAGYADLLAAWTASTEKHHGNDDFLAIFSCEERPKGFVIKNIAVYEREVALTVISTNPVSLASFLGLGLGAPAVQDLPDALPGARCIWVVITCGKDALVTRVVKQPLSARPGGSA